MVVCATSRDLIGRSLPLWPFTRYDLLEDCKYGKACDWSQNSEAVIIPKIYWALLGDGMGDREQVKHAVLRSRCSEDSVNLENPSGQYWVVRMNQSDTNVLRWTNHRNQDFLSWLRDCILHAVQIRWGREPEATQMLTQVDTIRAAATAAEIKEEYLI